jgi:hypothetical protein
MKNELQGWSLTEGIYDMLETENPAVSAVMTALEAIRPDVGNPFMILVAPAAEDSYPNYCQAFADEDGYVCEIRLFSGDDFTHNRAFLPDPEGGLGDDDDAQLPNLTQSVQIFAGFIADPTVLPDVDTVQWIDVSDEFEPVAD